MRRLPWLVLAVGALLIAGAWLVTKPTAPPLYDGLPMPADPYRYLQPPSGYSNPGPPLTVREQAQVVGGDNSYVDLASSEYPPQAELQVPQDSLSNASGIPVVAQVEFTITAVPDPKAPLPKGTQFHGNVYRFAANAGQTSIPLAAGQKAVVILRQPRLSQANPQLAELVDGHWQLLPTEQENGGDDLMASVSRFGDLTILENANGAAGGFSEVEILVLLSCLLVFAGAIVGVRFARVGSGHRVGG